MADTIAKIEKIEVEKVETTPKSSPTQQVETTNPMKEMREQLKLQKKEFQDQNKKIAELEAKNTYGDENYEKALKLKKGGFTEEEIQEMISAPKSSDEVITDDKSLGLKKGSPEAKPDPNILTQKAMDELVKQQEEDNAKHTI